MIMFDFLRNEYAAARLRSMKGHLLEENEMRKLSNSKSVSEIISYLEKTDYGETLLNFFQSDVSTIENELDRFYVNLLYKMSGFYPKKSRHIFEIFTKEWETRNIKIILKSVLTGEDMKKYIIKTEGIDWDSLSKINDINGIIEFFSSKNIYGDLVKSIGLEEKFGLFVFDFYLDKEYSDHCKKIAGVGMLNEIIKLKNDVINIRNVIRGLSNEKNLEEFIIFPTNVPKDFFGVKQRSVLFERMKRIGIFDIGDPSVLENNFMMESVFREKMISVSKRFLMEDPFGPGLLFYVILKKEDEINKIKTILKFVKDDLPGDELERILYPKVLK